MDKIEKTKDELRPLLLELGDLGGLAGLVVDGPRFRRKAALFKEIKDLYLQLSEDEQKKLEDSYGTPMTAIMFKGILKFSDDFQEGVKQGL